MANQLTQNQAVFFPSPSDVLFLLSYPAFIAALVVFLKAYAESGFPIGEPAGRRTLAGVTALLGAVLAAAVLRPVLLPGPPQALRKPARCTVLSGSMLSMRRDFPAHLCQMLPMASGKVENPGRAPILAAPMLPIFPRFHNLELEWQRTSRNSHLFSRGYRQPSRRTQLTSRGGQGLPWQRQHGSRD